tara:strand:+ start:1480 stop:2235 length:756 start_codon:yes stop_codon:yes gene_type:complete
MFIQESYEGFCIVGSGTLVFYEGSLFIMSAAHVFENLAREGAAYLHIVDKIFRLRRINVILSNKEAFGNDRDQDPLDLGAMLVPDEIIDYCSGKISFIEPDLIENNVNNKSIIFYQALGYPGEDNTKLAKNAVRREDEFLPNLLLYSGQFMDETVRVNPRFSEEYHIAINFGEKGNVNDDGKNVGVPRPEGMSGGLIQGCFDYLPHSDGLYLTCASGIIIEKDSLNRSIVGVRFDVVYEWLKMHSGQLTKS